jgi:hypothetical protein
VPWRMQVPGGNEIVRHYLHAIGESEVGEEASKELFDLLIAVEERNEFTYLYFYIRV